MNAQTLINQANAELEAALAAYMAKEDGKKTKEDKMIDKMTKTVQEIDKAIAKLG